jgi:outer membrane lipoprotein-sorting protein
MILVNSILAFCLLAAASLPKPLEPLPALQDVLAGMQTHEIVQSKRLLQYEAHRKFYAENKRFHMQSSLEVRTVFRRPDVMQSEIVSSDGSTMIREKVFDKILDAEQEAQSKSSREQVKITPDNYNFTLVAREDCGGRECYHLAIAPKKKDKFAIEGEIWVDAEDWAIVRLLGSPSRRPSFWTRHTEIERQYKRFNGVWLCESMRSVSDILVGGRSTLQVDYSYLSVDTEPFTPR